jgi:hypothetical protein
MGKGRNEKGKENKMKERGWAAVRKKKKDEKLCRAFATTLT